MTSKTPPERGARADGSDETPTGGGTDGPLDRRDEGSLLDFQAFRRNVERESCLACYAVEDIVVGFGCKVDAVFPFGEYILAEE